MTVSPQVVRSIRAHLIKWFERVARDLPWRQTRDPYRVWVSEIMLQQTRVDQAIPYYERFIDRYPNVHALATAELDEVLRDWEGLGYYARARNMHRAARTVVRENGGEFPVERKEMLALPGVGSYTANAVLSIARGQPLAVVDANVARVIARLREVSGSPKESRVIRELQSIADELIDPCCPGTFNEAMMELGATLCTPANPDCPRCPISEWCGAYANDTVEQFPVTRSKPAVPISEAAVALILNPSGRILIQRRPEEGLLGGLWEFPGGKIEPGETPQQACLREVREETGLRIEITRSLPSVRHAYSHFKVIIHPFICHSSDTSAEINLTDKTWISPLEFDNYAMPGATRKIIALVDWPSY